ARRGPGDRRAAPARGGDGMSFSTPGGVRRATPRTRTAGRGPTVLPRNVRGASFEDAPAGRGSLGARFRARVRRAAPRTRTAARGFVDVRFHGRVGCAAARRRGTAGRGFMSVRSPGRVGGAARRGSSPGGGFMSVRFPGRVRCVSEGNAPRVEDL